MLQGRRSRKMVAATLLTIMLTNTFAPGISYALTSGPTQPEATSFEPVDTTDMVNMQTGDLTYNIPLLEVPGPEGGYPLALSYHAALQPNEDASWVGLGWTLNPGAINRSVNGYPDDWYTPSTTRRDFWQGGSTKTYSVGVSVGLTMFPASVNFGLSFSQDTYRGFGVGWDLGVDAKLGKHSPLSASIGIGVTPYDGNIYLSGGLNVSDAVKGFNGSMGISFQTNFQSLNAGFSGGVGYSISKSGQSHPISGSLLGASISTGGGKPSLQIGGLSSSVSNANAGSLSTSSHGWHIDIPVYYGVNLSLGYNKMRYWSDESVTINTHGSLYPNGWGGTGNQWGSIADGAAYDEYSLLEDPSYLNIVDNPESEKVQGGAFPDFDVYSVSAQGLGGNMRPYMFQGSIVHQNLKNGGNPLVTYYSPGVTDNTPVYRFENDFSNSYRQNNNSFYSDASLNLRAVTPPMDPGPLYGFHDNNGNSDGNFGFAGGNSLAGSKFVSTTVKYKPLNALGYTPTDHDPDGSLIEGYSITNESGMTYHFDLPAYSFNEENYQEKLVNPPLTFTRQTKGSAYAYTWYLTSITGPDYVCRNSTGKPGDGDWGYWVEFEYGKWSNNYNWRNPSEGFQKDEDNQFRNCSMGTREVYYLNAIRTRTNVALFEKSLRKDGWGATNNQFLKNQLSGSDADYANTSPYDYSVNALNSNYGGSPSLSLSHIYLLNAADEGMVTPSSDPNNLLTRDINQVMGLPACGMASNVLDNKDVDAVGRANLEARSIRVIDFNYSYSLCPWIPNFFTVDNTIAGKLTLNSIATRGKGGANILPPTQFTYDLSGSDANMTTGASVSAGSFTTSNGSFQRGDMIMAGDSHNYPFYAGVITAVSSSNGSYTYTLANGSLALSSPITTNVYKTKNPPYNKDSYDNWGMYKSDFSLAAINANENSGRQTTPVSAQGVDAWSLRGITTPMGATIKINYEPDQFSKSVLNADYSYIVTSAAIDGNMNQLRFQANTNGYATSDLFHVGTNGKILLLIDYYDNSGNQGGDSRTPFQTTYSVSSIDPDGTIHVALAQAIASDPAGETFSSIITGNVSSGYAGSFGGGVRVNAVSVSDNKGFSSTVKYDFSNPTNGLSSGSTSYLPVILPIYDRSKFVDQSYNETWYKRMLYADVSNLYAISRELPPPGVMYEYVSVSNQIQNPDEAAPRVVPGVSQYQFEVFRPNMVGRVDIPVTSGYTTTTGRTKAVTNWGTENTHTLSLMKFTSQIGEVKRIVQYDQKDTATRKIISETINHYLDEGLENLTLSDFMTQYKARLKQFYYQGYLQERISEVKVVNEQGYNPNSQVMSTLSTRENYPSINTGQTVINYVNGTQTTSQNLAFDFYSGAVTQTLETDAYGNNFMTQTIPAYKQYDQPAPTVCMGLKINNAANLNMLTQTAATYMWKVDGSNNKLGLVSASVSTWSNQVPALDIDGASYIQSTIPNGNVWRMQSSYSWMSTGRSTDGTTPFAGFTDFNWSNPSASDPQWMKTSDITLYDVFSKALESRDMNNNYAATHMNYGEQKVVLTGGPANYSEIAYSGAEDAGVNQTSNTFIHAGGGVVSNAAAHTGVKSLLLNPSGTKGFSYSVNTSSLTQGRGYIARVWVKGPTVKLYYDVDGVVKGSSITSGTSTRTAGGWSLINLAIAAADIAAGSVLHVWCQNDDPAAQAYVDDMRFQPVNSNTTAYVYDPFSGELTHILDNNNLYTRFSYDAAGRLLKIYKEKLGVGELNPTEYLYNFGSTLFGNDAITNQGFIRNTCSPTQQPSSVYISVPAGTVTSFLSKADANQRAYNYAQDQANMQGTCTQLVTVNLTRKTPMLTGTMTVTLLPTSGGTTGTYTFTASGSTQTTVPILVLPGTYNLQFACTDPNMTYALNPGSYLWTGSNITTTTPVTFTTGTTYTIFAKNL